ncbi:RNA polymerase sigma-70 factor [Mangrovibacterium lignilyticum]|uniref:RNA polymerase sigma-70 factor n=1 Tax=Mangrovibacterium lignilyticum TaxID=2668052 RepID=UPI0013D87793|nr:RNA polymerase sigma-70 factor [Mangrovibacterium lignilyticum]
MDRDKQEKIFIKGLQDKNSLVFGQLFACYHASLFRFAETYLFDPQETEDVIQEVFIKLWEMPQVNIDRSLKSYLFLMVKNRCIDHLRSLQIEDKNKRKLFEAQSVSDATDVVLDAKSEALIKKTIEELPEQCKQVYQLAVFQDLKYQDIASELNISVSAVKVQMFRARKYLKENLGGLRESLSLFSFFRSVNLRWKK